MKVLSRLLCLPLPLPLLVLVLVLVMVMVMVMVMGQVEVNNFIGQANNEWIFTGTDGKTSRIISVDFEPKSIGSVYLLTAHTSEVNTPDITYRNRGQRLDTYQSDGFYL